MAPPASSSPLQTVPHPRTRLIGRQTELAAAHALLLDEAVPLLTLTGPGGIGKTRLALAIAHDLIDHFADGVAFVDLAVIADGALVPGAVGRVLGTAVETGPDPDEQLAAFCRPRQLLLVLDNCEHLIESVAALTSRLLAACPALQVLATSRAPLHLHVEHELPVPTLLRGADAADAVALFVERARMVRPGFRLDATTEPVLAAICRQLDGLPLAIELAASWIRLLLPGPLLARLSDRVLELTGEARDLPARQQTLREAIAWSHDLLSDGEQVLFWRLGVFAGGFDLDAASAVAAVAGGPDGDVLAGLAALMYQSLVQRAEGGKAPRFAMLETIRSFAVERLEASGELAAVREAHARYFLGLAEATAPHLEGPEQATWLDQLDRDHANLRAALGWVQERGDAGTGLRLAGALGLFWFMRGDLAEGRSWLSTVLAMPAATEPAIRAKAL